MRAGYGGLGTSSSPGGCCAPGEELGCRPEPPPRRWRGGAAPPRRKKALGRSSMRSNGRERTARTCHWPASIACTQCKVCVAGGHGAHLHGLKEGVDPVLSTCSGAARSTKCQRAVEMHNVDKQVNVHLTIAADGRTATPKGHGESAQSSIPRAMVVVALCRTAQVMCSCTGEAEVFCGSATGRASGSTGGEQRSGAIASRPQMMSACAGSCAVATTIPWLQRGWK